MSMSSDPISSEPTASFGTGLISKSYTPSSKSIQTTTVQTYKPVFLRNGPCSEEVKKESDKTSLIVKQLQQGNVQPGAKLKLNSPSKIPSVILANPFEGKKLDLVYSENHSGVSRNFSEEALETLEKTNLLALQEFGLTSEEIKVVQGYNSNSSELKKILKYYALVLSNFKIENDELISKTNLKTGLNPVTLLKVIHSAILQLPMIDKEKVDKASQTHESDPDQLVDVVAGEKIYLDNHKFVWHQDYNNREQIHIHLTDFAKKIGGGNYGQVFTTLNLTDGREMVAKVAFPSAISDLINEHALYTHLYNHQQSQSLKGIASAPISLVSLPKMRKALLFEKYDGGSLKEFMISAEFQKSTFEQKLQAIFDLLEGLEHLHVNKKVIHGDIKPGNILVKKPLSLGISDLGGSLDLSTVKPKILNKKAVAMTYTVDYVVPEDIKLLTNLMKEGQYEESENLMKKMDIYAMGRVFYQIITGKTPEFIMAGNPPENKLAPMPPSIPKKLAEFLEKMLETDHTLREFDVTSLKNYFRNNFI